MIETVQTITAISGVAHITESILKGAKFISDNSSPLIVQVESNKPIDIKNTKHWNITMTVFNRSIHDIHSIEVYLNGEKLCTSKICPKNSYNSFPILKCTNMGFMGDVIRTLDFNNIDDDNGYITLEIIADNVNIPIRVNIKEIVELS